MPITYVGELFKEQKTESSGIDRYSFPSPLENIEICDHLILKGKFNETSAIIFKRVCAIPGGTDNCVML